MAEVDGEDPKEYRWETGYEKTWEAIKEDDDGLLDSAIAEIIQKTKRKRQAEKTKQNRLGMMRHMYIIIDCSEATDFEPAFERQKIGRIMPISSREINSSTA